MGDKAEYFKEKLHFPENYEFGLAILLGKSANSKVPHQLDLDKIINID